MQPPPLIATLTAHKHDVYAVAFSRDGRLLASGGGYRDNTVRIWDTETWKQTHVLRGHKGRITALAFSPDGASIVSASADKSVKLWDIHAGQLMGTVSGHGKIIFSVDYSPTGNEFASCGQDGFVRVTDVQTLAERLRLGPHSGSATSVSYSPDGSTIASAGGTERASAEVCLWDVSSGRRIAQLGGHSDCALEVAWSSDGTSLASESYGEVLLWNAHTLKPVGRIKATGWSMICLAFTANRRDLVTGGWTYPLGADGRTDYQRSLGGVQVWEVSSAQLKFEFVAHDQEITGIGLSVDDTMLVTASKDGSAKVWNMGQLLSK